MLINEVYVIMESTGEYEDKYMRPIYFCLYEGEAKGLIENLNKEEKERSQNYENGIIQSKRNELLIEYAKKYNQNYKLNNENDIEIIFDVNKEYKFDEIETADWINIWNLYPEFYEHKFYYYVKVNNYVK